MLWQVCVLDKAHEKDFKKGKLVPLKAWHEKEKVASRSFVKADEKAKRNHPKRIVHTYITE